MNQKKLQRMMFEQKQMMDTLCIEAKISYKMALATLNREHFVMSKSVKSGSHVTHAQTRS